MRLNRLIPAFILFVLAIACTEKEAPESKLSVIPHPNMLEVHKMEAFSLKNADKIYINDEALRNTANHLNSVFGTELLVEIAKDSKKGIFLKLDEENQVPAEGYEMSISNEKILITSNNEAGIFYGVETIRQLLPADYSVDQKDKTSLIPMDIKDAPRFEWRGMHLDVSRHFMPTEFIKKYIDYLAMHKLNVFHWHLVDGIGWRMEVKSHPKLTDWGAYRVVKEDKMPWQEYETWKPGDDRPKYGGFYTQEEIKEIIQYAADRFITVVPEIELPGHSQVVFDCYPELICVDHEGNSLGNAGVYCAANDGSFKLLEDVLTEVIDLFPSEYIHIGGDEVGKNNWKNCARCSRLMHVNNFTPEELQSNFINHFDEFIRSKGRTLIGWHEITEGNLSESAAIMYWGGHGGTPSYLEKGHKTVLTPGSHLYFDHYQSLSKYEPKAFGGFSNIKNVYEFEPVPKDLKSGLEDNILGIQANVWTEYIPNGAHVEYMTLPRMAALSEVAWSKPEKDWDSFRKKIPKQLKIYENMGANYSNSGFRPQINIELLEDKNAKITILTEIPAEIIYTLDGTEPNATNGQLYSEPLIVKDPLTIMAVSKDGSDLLVEAESADINLHKARGAKIVLKSEGYGRYKAKSGATLIDIEFGGNKWGNGLWLGVLSKDLEAVVDLGEKKSISSVSLSCIEETGAGIYFPKKFTVWTSTDGKEYSDMGVVENIRELPIPRISDIYNRNFEVKSDEVEARYIKFIAEYQEVKNQGVFIFADELVVQ